MTTTKKQNLILLLTTDVHSEQVPNTYKIIINTLTGLVGSSLISHTKSKRRNHQETPTLDQRNEEDENTRGDKANEIRNEDFGILHAVMTPHQIASIANGIRHTLYEELWSFGEFESADSLLRTPVFNINGKVNFDQPMSLQMYLDYREKMAGNVDERRVKLGALQLGKPEDIIRSALLEQANRDKATIASIKNEVLIEASSLDEHFDVSVFDSFDIIIRCKIAEKIAEKFSAAYARLLPYAIGNLERASDLIQIEQQHNIVKQWIHENDNELKLAKLHAS